jgi:hypothetical protein
VSDEFSNATTKDFTINERLVPAPEGEPMPLKFEDLDPSARKFVQSIAQEEEACKQRIRKSGNHCWFCGSNSRTIQCTCLFPESFRCLEKNICADCSRAHKIIANHINLMLKYPVVRRADSRRFVAWRLLSEAIESIEEPEVNAGRVDLADTLGCNITPEEEVPWEASSKELRRSILGGFRKVRYVAFQKLAAALQQEIQDEALHSAAQLLQLLP